MIEGWLSSMSSALDGQILTVGLLKKGAGGGSRGVNHYLRGQSVCTTVLYAPETQKEDNATSVCKYEQCPF